MSDFDQPLNKDDISLVLQAVQEMLGETVIPALTGFEKYNVHIAMNMLQIARRQQHLQGDLNAAEQVLLTNAGLDPTDLQSDLADKIASGEVSVSNELIMDLKHKTLLQVAIDNPNYWGYLEAREKWGDPDNT